MLLVACLTAPLALALGALSLALGLIQAAQFSTFFANLALCQAALFALFAATASLAKTFGTFLTMPQTTSDSLLTALCLPFAFLALTSRSFQRVITFAFALA
jgi:hypothetical protein